MGSSPTSPTMTDYRSAGPLAQRMGSAETGAASLWGQEPDNALFVTPRRGGECWLVALAWKAGGPSGPEGSIPFPSAIIYGGVSEWLRNLIANQADGKTSVGSSPTTSARSIEPTVFGSRLQIRCP